MQYPEVTPEIRRIRRVALGDVMERGAARFNTLPAVVDGGLHISHAELNARSSQCAHWLLEAIGSGQQVATLCMNSIDMVITTYGIHKSANVWVPVNIMLDSEQIAYVLRHAEVAAVIVDETVCLRPGISGLLRELNLPTAIALHGDAALPWPALATLIDGRSCALPDVSIESDQPALIMYTSGTTGRPKGAVHSHRSVHSALIANIATMGFTERDVMSGLLPLFHCGQHSIAAAVWAAGGSVVLACGFDPGAALQAIKRERITVFGGLPMMYAAMLADAGALSVDFSSIRLCIYAMAPMPRVLVEQISSIMCENIVLATGQTEMYPITMSFRPTQHRERDANCWGTSSVLCETAIMDDNGALLPRGQAGEIVHRGPNAMLGYFRDPEATAAAQLHGWHHTGDLGMIDDGGQLLFLDRKKDMIKSGGENVASIRVETVLLAHSAVAAVAVVGLPHPRWSEAVCAFVVIKPAMSCNEEELLSHCRDRLGTFEVPKSIKFLQALPLTATGKVQKHLLRAEHASAFMADSV
jgi:long-chain acyl-CoA synthetase